MKLQKELEKINAQLMNTSFIERAPAERVAEVRARLADITQRMKSLEQALEALG